jgi:O-antigen/teichoic acid export membrane protein
MNMGLRGMMWGNFLVGGAVTLGLSVWVAGQVGLRWEGPVVRRMLSFSLPTVPAMAAATCMHYIDRFFLRRYATMGAVGLYAIAYQFPFMLHAMLGGSFERIWGASTVFTIARASDARHQYSRVCTYVMTVLAFAQFSLAISSRSVVAAFAAPDYAQAADYVPILSLAIWIYALHMFVRVGVVLSKRTHLFTVNYLAAFGVNVAANWLLVPSFGAMGAAVASLLTYAYFTAGGRFLYRSTYDLVFEKRRLLTAAGLGVLAVAARTLVGTTGFWSTALADLTTVAAYAGSLLFFPGFWTAGEREAMRSFVRGGMRRWLPALQKAD